MSGFPVSIRVHPCLNPRMLSLPPVIGHRGACGYEPENTLASFAKAADLGCRMVEFDVRLTADGVPIAFHDDTLDRRTDGRGPVGARTLAELRRLDAGKGERIPTLEDVLRLCLGRSLGVNIELKPDAGAERRTAVAAVELAARLWPSDRAPPLLSSFREAALEAAAGVCPAWPRGLLVERVPRDWRGRAERLGCAALHANHRTLTPARVAALKAGGLVVLAYTVNDRRRAGDLWRWGVDAVFSDVPDQL